jgi:tRNA (guanine37-N1)-methyltransferase
VRFDVLTLFPGMFDGPISQSIIARAIAADLIEIAVHDIRVFAAGRHRVCDDYPYGGGAGMVLKPEPVAAAIVHVTDLDVRRGPVILLTPQGRLLNQDLVERLAQEQRLTLVCGHYEGIDERVRERCVTDEISIGDFVLSGGEPAAIVVIDAVARRVPGVLSNGSLLEESHSGGLLEYPQYTRPPDFRGQQVPATLLSGHHAEVARWRRRRSLLRTAIRRPDLLKHAALSSAELDWLRQALGEVRRDPPVPGGDH